MPIKLRVRKKASSSSSGGAKARKKNPIKKVLPKFMLEKDPPVIARDPKPMAGLMEFQQKGLKGIVWKERFLVCSKGKVAWYPPECAIEGYVESKALGSIPVANVFESVIDGEGMCLDLITEKCAYHFRSKQTGEVAKWQDAVMCVCPPGAMVNVMKNPVIDSGIYKKNIWDAMGVDTGDSKKGGIPFGVRKELVSKEQNQILLSIFDLIKSQDVVNLDKEYIEDADLAKFVSNRMTDPERAKLCPTFAQCTDAVEGAVVLCPTETEDDEQCTFECFKSAICAPRDSTNPDGSEMARIIELAMAGQDSAEATAEETGEMSIGQKLFEYHKFMGNVLSLSRDGKMGNAADDKVSLTKVVAESYLNNVTAEVEMLIKRHKQYQERLMGLDPTLRSRCQKRGVDYPFDREMLPGEPWTKPC